MQTSLNEPSVKSLTRRYDIDWLRVIAFALLILFHTGMFFNHWGWHVKNNILTHRLDIPMRFLSRWRMPLLFMISGAGVYWALGKRSAGAFARERIKRILLPLLFGMFVIVPPQVYVERLTQGQTYGYLDFYRHVLAFQPYPQGDFSWHHLWYLAYIFAYSLLGLPLWLALRRPEGKRLTARWATVCKNPIWLIGLPVLWHITGELFDLPENEHSFANDWVNHFHYFSLFASGFILCTQALFWETLDRYRWLTLGIGLSTSTILGVVYWADWYEITGLGVIIEDRLNTLNDWCWLLTIFGWAYRYLNQNSPLLEYANQAVYPFYILHQTITVVAGYFLASLLWPWPVKFLLLVVITFGGSLAIYQLLIRPFSLTRLLFGVKAEAATGINNRGLAPNPPGFS